MKEAAIPYENRGGKDEPDEELDSCCLAMGVGRLYCGCEGCFVRLFAKDEFVRPLRPLSLWAQSVGMTHSANAILFDAAAANVLADIRRAAMSMAAKDCCP